MMSSNDSDDKPPQQYLQHNQPRKKRRRSHPLSPLLKINPYLALSLAVTLTIVMNFQPVINFLNNLIGGIGQCNGIGNCINSPTNIFNFSGGPDRQPQPRSPGSPQIDTPRQPPPPIQPSPQAPSLNSPISPSPTNKPVTAVPTQPAPERAARRADLYVYSRPTNQPPTQPDYVYSSSRPNQQPPLMENRYPQRTSEDYSDPPSNNTTLPSISYSTIAVTTEPQSIDHPPTNPTAPEQQSHQTSILEALNPNNSAGRPDDVPEPPATAGIVAIMSFFGWMTQRMKPQDSEDKE
jgi:hypothetical protein